jgi:hypothetical protein
MPQLKTFDRDLLDEDEYKVLSEGSGLFLDDLVRSFA